jgi:hypothetical protein
MTKPTITENQLLWLSGGVSNKASNLTGLPITESEDCDLAMLLANWMRKLGVKVEASTDEEGMISDGVDLEYDLLARDYDRLRKRLEYIRQNKGDNVAVNFALNAPDEEIDALEVE